MPEALDQAIKKNISETLGAKTIAHKESFIRIFRARYLEMLPSLIKIKNVQRTSIDNMKVEVALRAGYDIAIGKTTKNNIQVIGYATSKQTTGNPADLFNTNRLTGDDIHFVIPKSLRLKYYQEISYQDSCKTGDFVILRNKTINYMSDEEIVEHYISGLAEIEMSRFSLSMQVKVNTIFLGTPGDENINNLITSIYNGDFGVKAGRLFDPEDQIYHFNNEHVASNFQELKREFQNKVGELNNTMGINSLAVEKASGVGDEEGKSNRAFTTSNANIFLDGRNPGLDKLNKRYKEDNLQLEAIYNDEVVSEFAELERAEIKEEAKPNVSNDSHTE